MSEDIRKYKTILESAYSNMNIEAAGSAGGAHIHLHDPAQVARLVRHVFGKSRINKHILRNALLGHKNDPEWAMEVLDHLSQK